MSDLPSLAAIPLKTIDGRATTFGAVAGRATLVVNVASQCGFTPQYVGLEALYRRYKARGFIVLGFPCDQFGHQEPGDEAEIRNFCTLNYDVTFPLFAKTQVNGAGAHPLYVELKKAAAGLIGTQAIKWNFAKFLIAGERVVKRYAPADRPQAIARDIEALLG